MIRRRTTRVSITGHGPIALLCAALCLSACTKIVEEQRIASDVLPVAASAAQTGIAGQPLPRPIQVLVLDQVGAPLVGARVMWTIIDGGGSLSATETVTNDSGIASVTWTLGAHVATNTLEALISNGLTADIDADAVPGPPALLGKVAGDSQTVVAGTPSLPLQVQALDANQNLVAGATVHWTTTGGTLSAPSTTSDSTGATSVTLTPATAGTFTVTASVNGVPPVQFTVLVH